MKVLWNWNQSEPMDAIMLLPCEVVTIGVNCLVRLCKLWLVGFTVSDVVDLPELSLITDNALMIVTFWALNKLLND